MDVKKTADSLAARMATQLRVKGEGLAEVTAKAGRRLPRHLRSAAETIVQAQTMAEHPKLARLVDEREIRRAERKLAKYLARQNPRAERLNETLDVIAKIAFVIFVIVLAVFFFLLWRGYLT